MSAGAEDPRSSVREPAAPPDPWADLAKARHDLRVALWDDDLKSRLERFLRWLSEGSAIRRWIFAAIVLTVFGLMAVFGETSP